MDDEHKPTTPEPTLLPDDEGQPDSHDRDRLRRQFRHAALRHRIATRRLLGLVLMLAARHSD